MPSLWCGYSATEAHGPDIHDVIKCRHRESCLPVDSSSVTGTQAHWGGLDAQRSSANARLAKSRLTIKTLGLAQFHGLRGTDSVANMETRAGTTSRAAPIMDAAQSPGARAIQLPFSRVVRLRRACSQLPFPLPGVGDDVFQRRVTRRPSGFGAGTPRIGNGRWQRQVQPRRWPWHSLCFDLGFCCHHGVAWPSVSRTLA